MPLEITSFRENVVPGDWIRFNTKFFKKRNICRVITRQDFDQNAGDYLLVNAHGTILNFRAQFKAMFNGNKYLPLGHIKHFEKLDETELKKHLSATRIEKMKSAALKELKKNRDYWLGKGNLEGILDPEISRDDILKK